VEAEIITQGERGAFLFPRPLENLITGKCADEPESDDFRQSVAGIMRTQGRRAEAVRYMECGKVTRSYCPQCGWKELKTRVHRCGLRECPECARIEAKRLFTRIMATIKKITPFPGWTWRHLVITTKRVPGTPIRDDYLKVKSGLRALRAYFRKKQFAGRISAVGGIEFGPANAMSHVHIVIFSPFLDLREIQRTTGLGSCWVEQVKSARQVENATLYAVDFTESRDPVFIANMGSAMKGTRRVFTWGALYGCAKKEPKKKTDFKCPCCNTAMRWEYVLDHVSAVPLSGLSPGYA
jgi:hypothetical protein